MGLLDQFHFHKRNPLYKLPLVPFAVLGADHILSVVGYGNFVHLVQHEINQDNVLRPFLLSVIELGV